MRQPTPSSVLTTPQFLRDAAFMTVAGCQVNPLVLLIRDDGPALVDELDINYHIEGLAKARLEPQA